MLLITYLECKTAISSTVVVLGHTHSLIDLVQIACEGSVAAAQVLLEPACSCRLDATHAVVVKRLWVKRSESMQPKSNSSKTTQHNQAARIHVPNMERD